MMKNFKLICVLMIAAGLLEISCSPKHSDIGKRYDTSAWCKYPIVASSCEYETEHLIISVNQLNLEVEGEYYMEGFMELKDEFRYFSTVTVKGTNFYLALARDFTIVEIKSFFPGHAKTQGKFPFKLRFKSPPFDSYTFSYRFRVTDSSF